MSRQSTATISAKPLFAEAVLRPYEHGELLAGPGDPKLFARGKIEPERARRWRGIELPRPLAEASQRLARDLGYTV